jgi:5-methylcytosine-specific restriction endonuclease McrA
MRRPSYKWARDALWAVGKRACHYCGRALTLKRQRPDSMTVDHYKPRAAKGEDRFHNFVPACPRCNAAKGSMSAEEFQAKIADNTAFLPSNKELMKRAAFARQMERARQMRVAIGLETPAAALRETASEHPVEDEEQAVRLL